MLSLTTITVHPRLIDVYREVGVMRVAEAKGLAAVGVVNLRDFALDRHGTVDDRPYGGGDGMVLRPEPLAAALASLAVKPRVILPSPAGKLWTQAEAERLLATGEPLCFICGRFAGVDERFITQYVDDEYSLGDFVLSGGELPALAMMDSLLRLIPGVLGHEDSAANDSFGAGMAGLLEHPLYTRPPEFEGLGVPPVLLSGDHAAIAAWRAAEAQRRTAQRRPDLIR